MIYVLKFEPHDHFLKLVCPITGPRITGHLHEAEIFNCYDDAKACAVRLQPQVISAARITPRRIVIALVEE